MKKTIMDYRNDLASAEKQLEQATHRIERLEQKIKYRESLSRKDKETSDDHSPLSEALDIIEEFEQASGALKKTLVVLGHQLDMNIPKMDPCDLQAFTNLIEKYSNAYKRQIAGRGKSRR